MFKKTMSAIFISGLLFSTFAGAEEEIPNELTTSIEHSIADKDSKTYETISVGNGKLMKIDQNIGNLLKIIGGNATGVKTGPDFTQTGVSPVMIFFDTNCPYCKNLWQSSLDDKNKEVSIYWIPISVIDKSRSLKEGALFLDHEKSPYEIMSSFGNNNSYISIADAMNPSKKNIDMVQRNTLLFSKLGFNSVPLTLKITKDGDLFAQYGDISATDLKTISEY